MKKRKKLSKRKMKALMHITRHPNPVEKLPDGNYRMILSKGYSCFLDEKSYQLVKNYRWYAGEFKNGKKVYALHGACEKRKKKYKPGKCYIIPMHRFIMDFPKIETDHINNNGLDNRFSNLRPATIEQNHANRTVTKNPLGVIGVNRSGDSFIARHMANGIRYHLGSFPTFAQAAAARNESVRKNVDKPFQRLIYIPEVSHV